MGNAVSSSVEPQKGTGTARFKRFAQELQRDLLLWTASFCLLGAFRLWMILLFGGQMHPDGGAQVLKALMRGARFDSMVAAYPVALCLPLTLLCLFKDFGLASLRMKQWVAGIAVGLHLAICGITIGYFREYHDQFNQWIIGLITDDFGAIMRTIWRGYPILWYLLGYGVVLAACAWAMAWLLRRVRSVRLSAWVNSAARAALLVLVAAGLFFFAIRGWGIRRPVKQRDLAATSDPFLNKLVANPYVALRYAILDYKYVTGAQGLSAFLGSESIVTAAKRIFPEAASWTDIDQLCGRKAKGHAGPKPQHIFLIVCESLDEWTMLPEYQPLGLADGLLALATNGVSSKAFISAGFETIHAIGTLISGLPEAGVNINYQPSSRQPYATASAPIFKRLGYRTRFIYGGFSWQRVDEFALNQGFDEYEGVPSFKHLPPGALGTWGAFDEYLFAHLLEDVPTNVPSFNLVMTTVNHPPYDCDVFSRGFPLRQMPPPFDKVYDGTNPMKVFGHQWYTAKCAADFVAAAQKRFPGSIFVVTGDHASRHFLNSHPPMYELITVPCIIYGPEVLASVRSSAKIAGAHIDLLSTLVELSAGAGFDYASFGRNLLDGTERPVGFGRNCVVTPEFLFPLGAAEQPVAIPGEKMPSPMPPLDTLRQQYLDRHALSWWRVMKGRRLP